MIKINSKLIHVISCSTNIIATTLGTLLKRIFRNIKAQNLPVFKTIMADRFTSMIINESLVPDSVNIIYNMMIFLIVSFKITENLREWLMVMEKVATVDHFYIAGFTFDGDSQFMQMVRSQVLLISPHVGYELISDTFELDDPRLQPQFRDLEIRHRCLLVEELLAVDLINYTFAINFNPSKWALANFKVNEILLILTLLRKQFYIKYGLPREIILEILKFRTHPDQFSMMMKWIGSNEKFIN